MAKKRTQKQMYSDLFTDPSILFNGCRVTLFPNGEPKIIIRPNDFNGGVILEASTGPAGMRLEVRQIPGMFPLEVVDQDGSITMMQYTHDAFTAAHKKWYSDPDNNPHPDMLGIEPRNGYANHDNYYDKADTLFANHHFEVAVQGTGAWEVSHDGPVVTWAREVYLENGNKPPVRATFKAIFQNGHPARSEVVY